MLRKSLGSLGWTLSMRIETTTIASAEIRGRSRVYRNGHPKCLLYQSHAYILFLTEEEKRLLSIMLQYDISLSLRHFVLYLLIFVFILKNVLHFLHRLHLSLHMYVCMQNKLDNVFVKLIRKV